VEEVPRDQGEKILDHEKEDWIKVIVEYFG